MQALVIFIVCVALLAWFLFSKKETATVNTPVPDNFRQTLQTYVGYYRALSNENKILFEERVKDFLSYVRIHGVKTEISDTDRLLVAASAIIPIFGFKDWKYYNLKDVLIYEDAFEAEGFRTTGEGRNTLGMVGSGTMNNIMLLSKHSLEQGYLNKTDKNNTAIHEFVHLLDKSDGAVDGVPENLLDKKEIVPWLKLMHESIQEIKKNKSDINPYGTTNEAEFFAVASEYFFERPDLFQQKHPELFKLMEEIFKQEPQIK